MSEIKFNSAILSGKEKKKVEGSVFTFLFEKLVTRDPIYRLRQEFLPRGYD